ncbi:MAG: hypothetical protein ABR598_08690 [Candidatus Dormibacteria bacterium]
MLVAAGCGSPTSPGATGVPTVSPAACAVNPPAVGPDVVATLGADQDGGTFCFRAGDRFNVFLSVPPARSDQRWTSISPADAAVLKPVPSGALTLVRGVTAGIFTAAAPGTTGLVSSLPPCAPAAASCPPGQRWGVTIIVR